MILRVYKILNLTKVEGPGTRFCIWTQGCLKRCKGCYAKDTWDLKGGILYEIDEIIDMILSVKEKIEGITFLGGEPFIQAEALYYISKKAKDMNLSVVCFSGMKYDEILKSKNLFYEKLLSCVDLLIDGEFVEEKLDYKRPWVGSENQNYIFLTDRYSMNDILKCKNKIEIHFEKNGRLFLNGMGDFNKILRQLSLKRVSKL